MTRQWTDRSVSDPSDQYIKLLIHASILINWVGLFRCALHYSCLCFTRKINAVVLCQKKKSHSTSPMFCSVREVATLDGLSVHQHAELKICCLWRWRAKHINAFEATVILRGTNISEISSFWPPLLHVQSSQWLNWKINSNLNDWNKELLESEIKRLSSPRSPLIGKSFLQGILMVLREDCKAKLMSWRRVNSFCMCFCVSAWLYVRRVCVLFSCT